MGPVQKQGEAMSAFRLRYAKYCFVWLAAVTAPLIALLVLSPSVESSHLPFLWMFLYVGLPIGFGTALMASLGYTIGAGWSYVLEHNTNAASVWPTVKVITKAALILAIAVFAAVMAAFGLIDGSVLIPTRGKGLPRVSWEHSPHAYLFCMSIWLLIAVALFAYQYRDLRGKFGRRDQSPKKQ